jgi:hypothetical protein
MLVLVEIRTYEPRLDYSYQVCRQSSGQLMTDPSYLDGVEIHGEPIEPGLSATLDR